MEILFNSRQNQFEFQRYFWYCFSLVKITFSLKKINPRISNGYVLVLKMALIRLRKPFINNELHNIYLNRIHISYKQAHLETLKYVDLQHLETLKCVASQEMNIVFKKIKQNTSIVFFIFLYLNDEALASQY